jgi:glycosyltransferase involved in cell wall biosynthesis
MPFFSVVIPTYNRATCVRRAIDSVLRQTFEDYELIVVDDGSTDNTSEVVRGYGERIVYVSQRNRGVSAARNTGISRSVGDWVAFLDSDDEWLPGYLSKQAELVSKDPDLVGAVMNGLIDPSPGTPHDWFEEARLYRAMQNQRDLVVPRGFCTVSDHNVWFLQVCVFRRVALVATRLFDEAISIGEDWDIVAQVSLEGPLIFCSEIGARITRMEDDELRLSARFLRSGVYTRLCWERVFSRFLDETRLTVEEDRSLRRKFASNQRALANLYLRSGRTADARAQYRRAFTLDHSLFSLSRLALSALPPVIARLAVVKGRHIAPGIAAGEQYQSLTRSR